jgi:hypothetical protein
MTANRLNCRGNTIHTQPSGPLGVQNNQNLRL